MRTPEETGKSLEVIMEAMNSITLEELDVVLAEIRHSEGIGPVLDPTLWGRGGMMDAASQTRTVLDAVRSFKVTVSGIGNFSKVT